MKKIICLVYCFKIICSTFSQDMMPVIRKLKTKLDAVNNYIAEGEMRTDVAFIKAPLSKIKVYYQSPDHFKIKKDKGISILPKGGVSVNVSNILNDNSILALAAGTAIINNVQTEIIKILPTDENSDIILATLYVDVVHLLVLKAVITTKDNGTYQIDLTYNRYSSYGLPDKVIFSFDTKDYKMPRGVTLEFDQDAKPSDAHELKKRRGKIEINYYSYIINKGVDNSIFK